MTSQQHAFSGDCASFHKGSLATVHSSLFDLSFDSTCFYLSEEPTFLLLDAEDHSRNRTKRKQYCTFYKTRAVSTVGR